MSFDFFSLQFCSACVFFQNFLDPEKESCFGNALGKSLLSQFLGYDDVLLYSLKHLAGDRAHKGKFPTYASTCCRAEKESHMMNCI
jgi:Tumour-associated protein